MFVLASLDKDVLSGLVIGQNEKIVVAKRMAKETGNHRVLHEAQKATNLGKSERYCYPVGSHIQNLF